MENTRYARVFHSRQWSNYNVATLQMVNGSIASCLWSVCPAVRACAYVCVCVCVCVCAAHFTVESVCPPRFSTSPSIPCEQRRPIPSHAYGTTAIREAPSIDIRSTVIIVIDYRYRREEPRTSLTERSYHSSHLTPLTSDLISTDLVSSEL